MSGQPRNRAIDFQEPATGTELIQHVGADAAAADRKAGQGAHFGGQVCFDEYGKNSFDLRLHQRLLSYVAIGRVPANGEFSIVCDD